MKRIDKAFAYITFDNELLCFKHVDSPNAGIQVPAGTIGKNEKSVEAVLREAEEETGLKKFGIPMFLGCTEFDASTIGKTEIHKRHFFHLPFTGISVSSNWRHNELYSSDSSNGPIRFELFWLPVKEAVASLGFGHGDMLHRLSFNQTIAR